MKVLYLDTETTGLDYRQHDIIQIAMLAEVDGQVVDELEIGVSPVNWNAIDPEALATHNITIEMLKYDKKYLPPIEAFGKVLNFFDKHIDKFSKTDKFYPAGHNVQFDLDFLQAFFKRNGHKFGTGAYQNWQTLDSRVLANILKYRGGLSTCVNMKLATLCEYYGIKLQAHDALEDIKATRALMHALIKEANL